MSNTTGGCECLKSETVSIHSWVDCGLTVHRLWGSLWVNGTLIHLEYRVSWHQNDLISAYTGVLLAKKTIWLFYSPYIGTVCILFQYKHIKKSGCCAHSSLVLKKWIQLTTHKYDFGKFIFFFCYWQHYLLPHHNSVHEVLSFIEMLNSSQKFFTVNLSHHCIHFVLICPFINCIDLECVIISLSIQFSDSLSSQHLPVWSQLLVT